MEKSMENNDGNGFQTKDKDEVHHKVWSSQIGGITNTKLHQSIFSRPGGKMPRL